MYNLLSPSRKITFKIVSSCDVYTESEVIWWKISIILCLYQQSFCMLLKHQSTGNRFTKKYHRGGISRIFTTALFLNLIQQCVPKLGYAHFLIEFEGCKRFQIMTAKDGLMLTWETNALYNFQELEGKKKREIKLKRHFSTQQSFIKGAVSKRKPREGAALPGSIFP